MNKTSNNSQIQKFANILSLNASEAHDFLMQDAQYRTFDAPEYFDFSPVLKFASEKIGSQRMEECIKMMPQSVPNANLSFLLSKDGKYASRPLTLANPYLYCFLVNEMCKEDNWARIIACFDKFAVDHFSACALPVIPAAKEAFHNSTIVLNWWNGMEQRALELGSEYQYMFVTDITNCYGSISTTTIDKALSMKGTSAETDENHELAANMQKILVAMQQGIISSIPQGSATFDFIAEIVLGYADLLLAEMLEDLGISHYEVLRYRDDYRIFSNSREDLDMISYALQDILTSLGLSINPEKTYISEDITTDALKADKREYIYNTPICGQKGVDFDGLQKHLYFIHQFGKKHPNGSQIPMMLEDFDNHLLDVMYPQAEKDEKASLKARRFSPEMLNGTAKPQVYVWENVQSMVNIALQIAIGNVKHAPLVLRIISRLLMSVKSLDKREWILRNVANRLMSLRNMSYMELWLQNMTIGYDIKKEVHPYKMPLCRLAMGEEVVIWNNSWLKKSMTFGFPLNEVCKHEMLSKLPPVIKVNPKPAYNERATVAKAMDSIEDVDLSDCVPVMTIDIK